jgi:rSAM/selenodomain-associated transferase 2
LVSIIIPVYRDADALARTLAATDFTDAELIVSSTPDDESLAALRLARADIIWVDAPRGRARQMNAGAARARGEWLLFLHADTRLPSRWQQAIATADEQADETGGSIAIGCFRFALDSTSLVARLIEIGVRLRVWLFRLPYGDQALFLRRPLFEQLGGYADLPIMEDVDLVRRARAHGRLVRSPLPAVTSARRWEREGWASRTTRHLALIALYFCGVPPSSLVRLDAVRRGHPDTPDRRMYL